VNDVLNANLANDVLNIVNYRLQFIEISKGCQGKTGRLVFLLLGAPMSHDEGPLPIHPKDLFLPPPGFGRGPLR